MQERCDSASPALYPGVVSTRRRARRAEGSEGTPTQIHLDQEMEMGCQSDRRSEPGDDREKNLKIKKKNLIGQLAPWVIWNI